MLGTAGVCGMWHAIYSPHSGNAADGWLLYYIRVHVWHLPAVSHMIYPTMGIKSLPYMPTVRLAVLTPQNAIAKLPIHICLVALLE